MNILLTGGMGFIGSHTAVVLIEAGHDVVLFDNLSNADRSVLDRIETITGRRPVFIEGDIRDAAAMEKALDGVDAVIHFAGLKAVGESVSKPVEYYDNNVNGTLVLLAAMRRKGVNRIIFSSSSTVYGTPETLPLTEDCPTGEPTNPYGRSKLHIEQILADVCRAYPEFSAVCLRYFNPIGAHPSGLIGEDPNGIPNNLLPYVARVAHGTLPRLRVFGHDYPTPDGTGVRDFIHVMDLADGHAKAVPSVVKLIWVFRCNNNRFTQIFIDYLRIALGNVAYSVGCRRKCVGSSDGRPPARSTTCAGTPGTSSPTSADAPLPYRRAKVIHGRPLGGRFHFILLKFKEIQILIFELSTGIFWPKQLYPQTYPHPPSTVPSAVFITTSALPSPSKSNTINWV